MLLRAVKAIEQLVAVVAVSHLYETEPVGLLDQAPFYNAVVIVETDLGAGDLVGRLLEIEVRLGRVRERRWGPRAIDLDLILHGDTLICTKSVSVPHPHYRERRFVLDPLVAVWPDARDPDGTRVSDLLPAVADQEVRLLARTERHTSAWRPMSARSQPR